MQCRFGSAARSCGLNKKRANISKTSVDAKDTLNVPSFNSACTVNMLHSSKADNIGSGDVWQIYSGLEIASYDLKRDQHLSRVSGVDWHKSHSPVMMCSKYTYRR